MKQIENAHLNSLINIFCIEEIIFCLSLPSCDGCIRLNRIGFSWSSILFSLNWYEYFIVRLFILIDLRFNPLHIVFRYNTIAIWMHLLIYSLHPCRNCIKKTFQILNKWQKRVTSFTKWIILLNCECQQKWVWLFNLRGLNFISM